MSVVISSYVSKGGTAKSTTIQSLSAAFSILRPELKILVIDTDFQANTSETMLNGEIFTTEGYYSLMSKKEFFEPLKTARENVFVIPSSDQVNSLEIELSQRLQKELILKNLLEKFYGQFDLILIDCPPGLNNSVINVLTASDYVISPITPSNSALSALEALNDYIQDLKEIGLNDNLELMIVRNIFNLRTLIHRSINQVLEDNYSESLLKTQIPTGVAIVEAAANFLDIFELDKINENTSKVSTAYLELAKEVLTKIS